MRHGANNCYTVIIAAFSSLAPSIISIIVIHFSGQQSSVFSDWLVLLLERDHHITGKKSTSSRIHRWFLHVSTANVFRSFVLVRSIGWLSFGQTMYIEKILLEINYSLDCLPCIANEPQHCMMDRPLPTVSPSDTTAILVLNHK